MGISIEDCIKELLINKEDDTYVLGKETIDFVIDTMHKYRKIEQIVFPLQFCTTVELNHKAIMKICEVIENGKID